MFWKFKFWLSDIHAKLYDRKMMKKYPDYKADEYNCGELKFVRAVKSWDDLSGKDANIYTMNDIEIDYDRKSKEYILSFETVYQFKDGKAGEVKYFEELLDAFTKFMTDNNYKMDESFFFWTTQSDDLWRADSIPLLYTKFRLFVEGYKSLYK